MHHGIFSCLYVHQVVEVRSALLFMFYPWMIVRSDWSYRFAKLEELFSILSSKRWILRDVSISQFRYLRQSLIWELLKFRAHLTMRASAIKPVRIVEISSPRFAKPLQGTIWKICGWVQVEHINQEGNVDHFSQLMVSSSPSEIESKAFMCKSWVSWST